MLTKRERRGLLFTGCCVLMMIGVGVLARVYDSAAPAPIPAPVALSRDAAPIDSLTPAKPRKIHKPKSTSKSTPRPVRPARTADDMLDDRP